MSEHVVIERPRQLAAPASEIDDPHVVARQLRGAATQTQRPVLLEGEPGTYWGTALGVLAVVAVPW